MREIKGCEVLCVAGGDFSCYSAGNASSGYVTCWDSGAGISFTASYMNLANGSTNITLYGNSSGSTFSKNFNSAQQLGSFILAGGVGATVIGLGGSAALATAIGMAASAGYGALWNASAGSGGGYASISIEHAAAYSGGQWIVIDTSGGYPTDPLSAPEAHS